MFNVKLLSIKSPKTKHCLKIDYYSHEFVWQAPANIQISDECLEKLYHWHIRFSLYKSQQIMNHCSWNIKHFTLGECKNVLPRSLAYFNGLCPATYDQTMGNRTVHLHVINRNVFGLLEASSNIAVYILTII